MAEPTIRMIWGLAKSPELSLSSEDLHLLVQANTGKDSIKQLNKRERGIVIGILQKMKDSATGKCRETKNRRGNTGTANQRKKIYKLCEELGWDKPSRINGLCQKMFKIASVEWLDYQQCSKLIEALKSMVARKEKNDGTEQCKEDN